MYNDQDIIKPNPPFFKTISVIHLAMIVGQVVFGITAFYITNSTLINFKPDGDPVFYVVLLLIIFGILGGSFIFKQQVAKLAGKQLLIEKTQGYQTALIIRFALAEGASLFGIVSYLDHGNLFYLILVGVNVLYFIWIRPTKSKADDDLNLSYEDKIALGW
jgi:hypothetical protein